MDAEQLKRLEAAARRLKDAAPRAEPAFFNAEREYRAAWTPSAALALVERLRELERQLAVACKVNVGDKDRHDFDWSVLTRIDELEADLDRARALAEAAAPLARWVEAIVLPDAPPLRVEFDRLARSDDVTIGDLRLLAQRRREFLGEARTQQSAERDPVLAALRRLLAETDRSIEAAAKVREARVELARILNDDSAGDDREVSNA